MTNESSGKLWPIHLKPKEDELLTSWLARIAQAHGTSYHHFCFLTLFSNLPSIKYGEWEGDLDRFASEHLLMLLSEKTATPIDKIRKTMISSYEGILFEEHTLATYLPWVIPNGANRRKNQGNERIGLQFCPYCLSEDLVPYFRRSWKLAIVTMCIKHKIVLLDRCQHCQSRVSYRRALSSSRIGTEKFSLTACFVCGKDLKEMDNPIYVKDSELKFQEYLLKILKEGFVEIPYKGFTYSHLYFTGLRILITAFVGGKRAFELREKISNESGINNFTLNFKSHKNQYIELLTSNERRGLLTMMAFLLEKWPDRFIEFCSKNKLWSDYFVKDKDKRNIPFWLWSIIHDHLYRIAYEISKEELEAAYKCLIRMAQEYSYRPQKYPEKMKAVADFLVRARRSNHYLSNKWPNLQKSVNWLSGFKQAKERSQTVD